MAPPPPSRKGKTVCALPFKEWENLGPPLQYGFKLPRTNHPNTFCAPPPSARLKHFPTPLFVGVKLHILPSRFVPPPPPLPIISDQSLMCQSIHVFMSNYLLFAAPTSFSQVLKMGPYFDKGHCFTSPFLMKGHL